jgi:hypothetical protein
MPSAAAIVTIVLGCGVFHGNRTMQKLLFVTAMLASSVLASGCKQKVGEPAPAPSVAATPAATTQVPEAKPLPRIAPPARIAEIKQSGQHGLWATPGEFCPGKRTAILTWNVEASGAEKVILYVVGKDGIERNFGRGGPVGERQTGPWVRPGVVFKLRNADGGAELGEITIKPGASC